MKALLFSILLIAAQSAKLIHRESMLTTQTTTTYSHTQQLPAQYSQNYIPISKEQTVARSLNGFIRERVPQLQETELESITKKEVSVGTNYICKYIKEKTEIYVLVWDDARNRERQIKSVYKSREVLDELGQRIRKNSLTKKVDGNIYDYLNNL